MSSLFALTDVPVRNGARLACNSRMAAKVDSAAVQDGFGIYRHSFFLAADGFNIPSSSANN